MVTGATSVTPKALRLTLCVCVYVRESSLPTARKTGRAGWPAGSRASRVSISTAHDGVPVSGFPLPRARRPGLSGSDEDSGVSGPRAQACFRPRAAFPSPLPAGSLPAPGSFFSLVSNPAQLRGGSGGGEEASRPRESSVQIPRDSPAAGAAAAAAATTTAAFYVFPFDKSLPLQQKEKK